jgi:predicted DsbA family dithiol-disulfide isomerase
MNERAIAVGLPPLTEERVCSSTIRSHRLVRWVSATYGLTKAEELYDILNYEHFINGAKLNSMDFLMESCSRVSIDTDQAKQYLLTQDGRQEVYNTINTLVNMQVSSIPVFIINSFWGIEGAVTTNRFVQIFREIESHILQLEQSGRASEVVESGPFLFEDTIGLSSVSA